jgi:hypothetical protein
MDQRRSQESAIVYGEHTPIAAVHYLASRFSVVLG